MIGEYERNLKTRPRICSHQLVLFFLACAISSSPSHAQNARDVAQNAFRSVVLLVTEDAKGQPLGYGSGFIVKDETVASNLHVVRGAAHGFAKLVGQKDKRDIEAVAGIDAHHDLVLLHVSGLRAPALALADGKDVAVGDEAFAIGNPKGLEGTFSSGIVSGIREIGEDKLLQMTAPISPGSSGGPVLDKTGKVIGVAVAFFKGGQNLNFAIPVSNLRSLLDNATSLKPVPTLAAKISDSVLNDIGDKGSAGVVVSSLVVDAGYGGYSGTEDEAKSWAGLQGKKVHELIGSFKYSFSLKNNLRQPVRNVRYRIIFYDKDGEPIDAIDKSEPRWIQPGLAKRIPYQFLTPEQFAVTDRQNPKKQIEIRVFDFELAE